MSDFSDSTEVKEKFKSGGLSVSIGNSEHAEKVINDLGWLLAGIGGVLLIVFTIIFFSSFGIRAEAFGFVFETLIMVFLGAAIGFLRKKWIVLIVLMYFIVNLTTKGFEVAQEGGNSLSMYIAILFLFAGIRAVRATFYISRNNTTEKSLAIRSKYQKWFKGILVTSALLLLLITAFILVRIVMMLKG